MTVFALVSSVRAFPEPAVLLVFNGVQEVFANNFRGLVEVGGIFAVLFRNRFLELFLVPVLHRV